jgi:hypothetical protein
LDTLNNLYVIVLCNFVGQGQRLIGEIVGVIGGLGWSGGGESKFVVGRGGNGVENGFG